MAKLSKSRFDGIERFIMNSARPLERYIFEGHFKKGCNKDILNELKRYQNADGGFGHGMESDFRLPNSSPIASSVAFEHLINLDENEDVLCIIKKGIEYFEDAFIPERNGWFAVDERVNDYPHTPWWNYNKDKGMTVIDEHWGNPSAEIIGYLYRYKHFVSKLDVSKLVDYVIKYINEKKDFESFHEIYCYIRLHKLLPRSLSVKLEDKLKQAIEMLVNSNSEEWKTSYVSKPLDFVNSPQYTFGIRGVLIEKNLDYIVECINEDGLIFPSWGEDFYKGELKAAWNEWIGVLTLKALITLDNFGRIEI